MDIQDQYLDIQICDKHLIYSIVISGYSALIFEIAECKDINVLNI